MKHLTSKSLITGLTTIGFAIVIMLSPQNVFAYSQVFPTIASDGEMDGWDSIVGSGSGSYTWQTYQGVYPDTSVLISNALCASVDLDVYNVTGGGWANGNSGSFWTLVSKREPNCVGATTTQVYFRYDISGGVVSSPDGTNTRLISFDPDSETVGTTSPITIQWYINPIDWEQGSYIRYSLNNLRCNSTLVGIGGIDICSPSYEIEATTTGYSGYSTTTIYQYEGKWDYRVFLQVPDFCFLGLCYDGGIEHELTGNYIVASTTLFDTYVETFDTLLEELESTLSTSTQQSIITSCNPISNNVSTLFLNPSFDLLDCTFLLFLPNSEQITTAIKQIKDGFIVRFPIGYVTDFVSIVSSTTTVPLVVIDTRLPAGFNAGNDRIRLDLNNVLDGVLYATATALWTTSSTSASTTLYDVTFPYWRILVYLSAGLYILRRVLGSHLIPKFNHA